MNAQCNDPNPPHATSPSPVAYRNDTLDARWKKEVATLPAEHLVGGNKEATARKELLSSPSTSSKDPIERRGYIMGDTIGVGAYAKVKLARSARSGRKVAIKIITKATAPEGYLAKFYPRELQAMETLSHPHVIQLYDHTETIDRSFLIMEYAAGGDLLEHINKNGALGEVESRRIFLQLASAIGFCHSSNIIHRDVKCENILLDANFNVKLSDFGFAITVDSVKTRLQTHCGSYAYAAPEILHGEPYIGTHTDIWSMGVILFAMVCGRLPYNDSNLKTLLTQLYKKLEFPKRVTADCQNFIRQILAVHPEKRISIANMYQHAWILSGTPEDTQNGGKAKMSKAKPSVGKPADVSQPGLQDTKTTATKPPASPLPNGELGASTNGGGAQTIVGELCCMVRPTSNTAVHRLPNGVTKLPAMASGTATPVVCFPATPSRPHDSLVVKPERGNRLSAITPYPAPARTSIDRGVPEEKVEKIILRLPPVTVANGGQRDERQSSATVLNEYVATGPSVPEHRHSNARSSGNASPTPWHRRACSMFSKK